MTRLTLRFSLSVPADRVFAALADPEQFVAAHPLLVAMTPVRSGHYRVRERVARGPLPLHFSYPAWMTPDRESRTLGIQVRIWRMVRVHMEFRVIPDGPTRCEVEEDVVIRSFLPVHRTLQGVFREEHARLFRTLESTLGEASDPGATSKPGSD